MINRRGKRVDREAVFLPTFVFVRVEDKNLNDTLGIYWKIPTEHAILSEKDTKHDVLKDFDSPFVINIDLYK